MYNERVDERERRREFVTEFGLMDLGKVMGEMQGLDEYEREIVGKVN